MILFQKLSALPYVCLGSLLIHLGDGVHFLGDTGVVGTNISRLGLVFSADCTETNPLSQALVHWLEIRCGLQLKPVAAVTRFSKFSKPAPPTPNASRFIVLSMISRK